MINEHICRYIHSNIDFDDRAFVEQRLSLFPEPIQKILFSEYLKKKTKFEKNSYLRVIVDSISKKISVPLEKLNLNISEESLREKSKELANAIFSLRRYYLNDELAQDAILSLLKLNGIHISSKNHKKGEVARFCDEKWWLKKLRKINRKNIEIVLHHLNQVNLKKSLYCSNYTLKNRHFQKLNQREYLANTIATNQFGQSFSLLDLSQKGVSDPKIRKSELMVRARGFEDLANALNHVATFLTITCPSKYHRSYAKSGHENPKWGGFTPIDGQSYLNNVWSLIRSKLNRLGIRFYGFRVAEPQHDGTPHWHLLLFVEPAEYENMIAVMREYAMREDGLEKGAAEHRFTEVKIDPSKGSATGYIAKYISKNIDGEDLGSGTFGEDPLDAAARVDAWASCWGIRQFQQLGGCSVTVWRELRRLKETQVLPQFAREIIEAADSGDWKSFTQKMGGVFSRRKEQVFKPYYAYSFDSATGAIKTSLYCSSELVRVLKGVITEGVPMITRVFQWRISSSVRHGF